MRFLFLCLLPCSVLFSTEIDSFTLRDPQMRDGLEELNNLSQGYFNAALVRANQAHSCDPKIFEQAFYKTITGIFWSKIESDIDESKTLDRRTIERKNSIYRDVNILEGCILHMARLGFLIKTGEIYVGSDKLGHFFDTGYQYYQKSSLEEAMKYGEMTERTYYGLLTTSVYSYGDLASNLDGYFFWTRLAKGKEAYVTCQNNIWTQKLKFDLADYINPAWDEALNCNYYRNDHVTYSVAQQISDLGMSCPIDTSYCTEMLKHYGPLAYHVVGKECFL